MNIRGDPDSKLKREVKKQIREAIKQNTAFKEKLRERGIEGKYIRNVTQRIINDYYSSAKLRNAVHIIKNNKPATIINVTLTWSNTKEGISYWENIYDSFLTNRLD